MKYLSPSVCVCVYICFHVGMHMCVCEFMHVLMSRTFPDKSQRYGEPCKLYYASLCPTNACNITFLVKQATHFVHSISTLYFVFFF